LTFSRQKETNCYEWTCSRGDSAVRQGWGKTFSPLGNEDALATKRELIAKEILSTEARYKIVHLHAL
jgi:hypothetical protein